VRIDRAVVSEQESIPGPCGGQAAGLVDVDDVTGNFWGNLTFANYCDSNVTLNGYVDFSGTFNLISGAFENISLSLIT
jgi:hypothetical protein